MMHSDNSTTPEASLPTEASDEAFPGIDQPIDPALRAEVLRHPNIRLGLD